MSLVHHNITSILICLMILAIKAPAQDLNFNFTNLTTKNGLKNNSIRCLLEDVDGYIWIGTEGGLHRYDGRNMKVYQSVAGNPHSLISDRIDALYLTKDSTIWVLAGGLHSIEYQSKKITRHQISPSDKTLSQKQRNTCILEDAQRNLWLGFTSWGICQLDRDSMTMDCWKPYPGDSIPPAKNLTNSLDDIIQDKTDENLLWCSTRNGVLLFDKKNHSFQQYLVDQFPNAFNDLWQEENGELWVSHWGSGIHHFIPDTGIWEYFPNHAHTGKFDHASVVRYILPKSHDELWVTTRNNSLGIFNKSSGKYNFVEYVENKPNGILSDMTRDLLEDRNGILWIGTDKGLSRLDKFRNRFKNIDTNHSRKEKSLSYISTLIFNQKLQKYYAASWSEAGLYIFDSKFNFLEFKPLFERTPNGKKPLNISYMLQKEAGKVWILTSQNLYIYDTEKEILAPCLKSNFDAIILGNPLKMIELRNGNLLIGTQWSGLFEVDIQKNELRNYLVKEGALKLGSQYFYISGITESKNGDFWLAYHTRVSKMDRQTGEFLHFDFNMDDSTALNTTPRFLAEDDSGIIWVGGISGGLHRIDPKEGATQNIRKYVVSDGLASNDIYGMLKDQNGIIWMTSSGGLTRFDPEKMTFKTYSSDDGLRESERHEVPFHLLDNGYISLGYAEGFTIFHPDSIISNTVTPKVVLTDFKVMNESLIFDKDLNFIPRVDLNYKDNFFSIDFAALNFSNPESNQFAYKLEGFHDDWIYDGNRTTANFTNIEGGDYVFRVKAANNDGFWNEQDKSLRIVVKAPFWETMWFRFSIILTLIAFIVAAYKWRTSRIRQKAQVEQQITELELKALKAQMNPHFIFNCLQSIKQLIQYQHYDQSIEYLTKFSKLIRKVLNNSEKREISLEEELEVSRLYLEMESLRFSGKFDYSIEIDDLIDTSFVQVPAMIFQPFLENAIWHGLLHKEEKGNLLIQINKSEDYIKCHIEDDGIGRKVAQILQSKSATRHKSMGIKITEDRLNLNYRYSQNKIEITVIDKVDARGNSTGTRVEINLPV